MFHISVLFYSVKYLGLLAMSKILKTHPKSVQAHKDLILQCLDDKDESIRLRALDLLYGMVSLFAHRSNLGSEVAVCFNFQRGHTFRCEAPHKEVTFCCCGLRS